MTPYVSLRKASVREATCGTETLDGKHSERLGRNLQGCWLVLKCFAVYRAT